MTNRVSLGYPQGGYSGIQFLISKPGRDCFSGNLDDLLLGPGLYNALPVVSGIVTSLPKTGSSKTSYNNTYTVTYGIDVYHNLGYVPMFVATGYGVKFCTVRANTNRLNISFSGQYATDQNGSYNLAGNDGTICYAIFSQLVSGS